MLRSILFVVMASLVLVGCPKGNPCGDLVRDPATESCVCPDGFTPRPELGICEGPDGSVIRYDAGMPADAGEDAPEMDAGDSGVDTGVDAGEDGGVDSGSEDACIERTFFRDADDDGFGHPDMTAVGCVAPEGFVEDGTDCDDACETCFPGGTEVCDERDNDCDGVADDGVRSTFYRDMDGDSFGDPTMAVQACAAPSGYVANDDDCNDGCAACRPGGTEVCEGSLDENCSMGVDEGCACTNGSMRACPGGTDVGACVAGIQACSSGAWGACMGAVGPIAESCDGVDNDCDTIPDNGTAAASCGTVSRATGVGCSGGSCFVSACSTGYRDCDGMFANGCESQLGTLSSCLACGDTCGWACEATGCNDAVIVSAGAQHSCATRESGSTVCWGRNANGALGDGSTATRAAPVPVVGLTGVQELALGENHSCARRVGGTVWCWGRNTEGQLGDSTNTQRLTPVEVTSLPAVASVDAGENHSCAVLSAGTVWCWGANFSGQLGNGSTTSRNVPVQATGVSGATQVTTGTAHSCALINDGTVRCWGSNASGQLGDGTAIQRNQSVQVSGITNARQVAAGDRNTCAILATGRVVCWGFNEHGQLGNGTTSPRSLAPVEVSTLTQVTELVAGPASNFGGHFCARRTDGSIWCWGKNDRGQVGDGSTETRTSPVRVLMTGSALAAGGDHSCAVVSGAVMCWGSNSLSQLGDGTTMTRLAPTPTLPPT